MRRKRRKRSKLRKITQVLFFFHIINNGTGCLKLDAKNINCWQKAVFLWSLKRRVSGLLFVDLLLLKITWHDHTCNDFRMSPNTWKDWMWRSQRVLIDFIPIQPCQIEDFLNQLWRGSLSKKEKKCCTVTGQIFCLSPSFKAQYQVATARGLCWSPREIRHVTTPWWATMHQSKSGGKIKISYSSRKTFSAVPCCFFIMKMSSGSGKTVSTAALMWIASAAVRQRIVAEYQDQLKKLSIGTWQDGRVRLRFWNLSDPACLAHNKPLAFFFF